jgi:hypothetical protein
MTCRRKVIRFFVLAASILVPLTVSAANFDVKVLVDTDNRRSTGCTVNTTGGIVSGIDVILTTTGTTGAANTVTGVTRQTCVTPSLNQFSAPVAVDGGWNVGVSSTGDLFVESHYGTDLLTWTNVGSPRFVFTTSSGSLTDILLSPNTTGGGDIVLPRAGRSRAVASGPPRLIQLDGASADWNGVGPLAIGGAATPAWRFISASVFAGAHDLFFNFQIHTNPAAPTANDDNYALATPGGTLTVATLGVLNNDNANGQAITAVLVSNPQHGTLTLNPNGGFTYAHDGSLESQDQFRYVAQGPVLVSNIATVTISMGGTHAYTFTSADNVTFPAGQSKSFTVSVSGQPTPALTEAGALPSGITFVDNGNGTGTLSGTAAGNAGGIYSIVFTAEKNKPHETSQNFTLTIGQPPHINSDAATTFTAGTSGTFTVTATGFPAPTLSRSGTLPAGVTFNAATGALSGTPAPGSGGQYPITFTASNDFGSENQSFLLTVNEAPFFTSANATTLQTNVAGSFTVTVAGYPAPTITRTGTLPGGVTFTNNGNGTATISGTPASGTGGSYPLVLGASNGVGAPASQNFTLTINQPPAITSANVVTFTVGAAGTFTVTATGFPAPAIAETGTLPSGVTYNAATHVLSGTPAVGTGGVYPISFTASNGVGSNATQTFTLTINEAASITSANAVTFQTGVAGSFTVTTLGFPKPAISKTGALPSGVTLTDNANGTATLAGTAASGTGGTYPLAMTAANGVGANGTQNFTLTVNQPPAITSANAVTFTVGAAGSFTVTATGFPAPAIAETGTLPSGVTYNATTHVLSGTPNVGTGGVYPISFTASNGVGSNATQTFTLTINEAASITSANAVTFQTGVAGSFTVTTLGFPKPAITKTGALPSGVTLTDNANGTATLAGTAASGTGGTYPLAMTAANGVGANGTQNFTLTVNQPPAITSANAVTFTVGAAGSFTVTATGFPAPAIGESGTLPSGVTYNSATHVLSGTAAVGTGGVYPISFTASNGVGSNATQNFALTINEAASFTSANAVTFHTNVAGTFTFTTLGYPKPSISETGGLPAGVTLTDNANGTATLAGTPGAATGGTYPLTLTAANGVGANGTQNFTLTVNQPPAVTSANNATFQTGLAGTFTVTTTGFPSGASMVISETGAIPSGLSFADNHDGTATIAGTPAAATGGIYAISITANNGIAPNATQSFTLTVNQPPAITSANNVTFTVGAAGTFNVTTTGFPTGASMLLSKTGTLPSGVTFVDNHDGTATLAGTPAAASGGTYPLTITANNGAAPNATQTFTLTINQAPVVTSANNVTFQTGVAGTFTVTTTGFPTGASMVITKSGTLPAGVTFVNNNNGTATLAGTPNAGTGGTYPITITANNGVTPNGTQSFTLTVNQPPAITSANAVTFTVGTAGTFAVTVTGFPAPTVSETGSLPSGVTFNAATKTLSGTPAVGTGGIYNISFTASNGVGSNATQSFTLTINEAASFTSANNVTFQTSVAGTFTITTLGFPKPAITKTGGLPSGVTLTDNADGTATLAGTPGATTGAAYPLALTATNGVGSNGTQNFTLTVNQPPAITSANATTFTTGTAGSFTVTVTGFPAPTVSESGGLPSGVTFNTSTKTLSGTPGATSGGIYNISFTATNAVGSDAVQSFTLTVNQAPVITSANAVDFAVSTVSSFTITTTGFPTPTVGLTGTLPAGMSFTANPNGTGTISGTPTAGSAGTYPLTVTATNVAGSPNQTLTIHVWTPPITVNDSYAVAMNIARVISAPGVLGNDTVNGATITSNTQPSHGSVTLNADGSFTYTPTTSYVGADSFTYTLGNFAGNSTATVSLTVFAAPVANADTYNVATTAAPGVLGNDSVNGAVIASYGVNGNEQSTIGSSTPTAQAGGIVLNADGSFTYTPAGGFTGDDTFKYTLTNFAGSSTATVTLHVNIAPVNAVPAAQSTNEDTTLVFSSGNSNAISISDADAGTSTVQVALTATNGIVTLSGTTGLTVTGGANGTNTVTVTGTIADINTALAGLTFLPTLNYNGAASLQIVTNDLGNTGSGGARTDTDSIAITVNAVNDAPVLTAGVTLSYTENQAAAVIDNTVTVNDVDNANLASATAQITGNYVNGEDVLSFATIGAISGSFNASTGTMTLTGSDTLAAYQAALRTVKYANTSDNPSTSSRTVTWIGNDGALNSAAVTSTITITAVNDAPVLTAGGILSYTENQAATAIDGTITIADPDSANLTGATVQITGNYVTGEDVLSFTTANGISGIFTAGTGTLTLSGSSSVGNYQTALQNVKYANTSDNPSTAARTVTWQVNDGAGANNLSNTPTSTINVTAVDDAPVLTAGATLGYTENQSATAIDTTILVTDVDNANIASATVQITGNYASGQDVLGFTTQNGITGIFTAGTGTLALSGSATLANYQTALRSVTYANTSDNPSTSTRTVSWSVNDGTSPSNTPTSSITITAVNDAPALTAGSTLNYTENQSATAIDTAVTITDPDSATLSGATIQITSNYVNGEDVLGFSTQNGISGSFNATSGTMTLSGSASVAFYQTALRSVTYVNASENPSASARTVSWQVNDGAGANNLSNVPTSTINVTPVNDAPVLTAGGSLTYTEANAPSAIDNTVTVSDVDNVNITGATVQITGNYLSAQDVLSFTTIGSISGVFNSGTGTMTLSGTDTKANYQAALRTVKYNNTSTSPSIATRTVTWIATDGTTPSTGVTSTITVISVNTAPTITAGGSLAYTENQIATVVNNAITVTDPDTANMAFATVQISTNYVNGEDVLSFATIGAISGSFNATNGTMTLSGSDTLANYQAALRTVKYANTSDNPSTATRTVSWQIDDGDASNHLSNTATSTITVAAVNDAPVITAGNTLAYIENQAASAASPALTLTDADSANISGATVQLTTNYANGQDILAFATIGPISGTFAAGTGTLTLTGTDTVANYQAALRTVTYFNNSDNPTTSARTVVWIATDGVTPSTSKTSTITVAAVNDAPVVTASGTLTYTENAAATVINSTLTVTDADSTNLTGATVQITANYVNGEDVLSFVTIGAISGSFNAVSGTMTLSGSDTVANYQAALRTVKYANTSDNPSTLSRTVTWIATDGTTPSSGVTTSITVVAVNDIPVVTAGNVLAYTENQSPVAVSPALGLVDPDSTITGATAQITANYLSTQDVLSFTTIGAISGTFNSATGTMTLTGTDTVANYQAALRTVNYNNTSESPSTLTRTVTWLANDGTASSVAKTSTITVASVNDAPIVTASGTLTYTENDVATVVNNGVTVSDVDSANLTGATVQISTNYANGQDVLSFATIGPISGIFTAATGTLALSGTDTVANYQAALRTVKYANTSDNPSTLSRTVSWSATDGTTPSSVVTTSITVVAVNDIPVITAGNTLAYLENQAPAAVSPALTLVDPDSTITGATAQITANYLSTEDVLSFVTIGAISGTFNSGTGTMTLTGTDTVANYQAALRTVKYNNTSENPSALSRTVTWLANDGTASSVAKTSTITVTPVNDAPVLTAGATLTYTENDPAAIIDNTITVADVDSANITGATVTISANFNTAQDVLSFATIGPISGSYNAVTGVLTLTGSDTLANYQAALRTVKYANTSDNPTTVSRTVTWVATDGTTPSTGVTSSITVIAVNDPPVLGAGGNTTAFTESGVLGSPSTAVVINPLITVTDVDSTNLASATVSITANLQVSKDVLGFATQNGITGVYDGTSGILTLSGPSTVANYQTALRSITYNSTSEDPTTASRTITFLVDDGGTPLHASNTVTSTVTVTATNDPPTATGYTNLPAQAGIPITYPAGKLFGTDVAEEAANGTTVSVVTTPDSQTSGLVTINANGSFTFTPGPGTGGGTASFTYHVVDTGRPGAGVNSAPVTVSFAVAGPSIYFVKNPAVGLANCTLGNECLIATAITNGGGVNASTNIFLEDANTHTPGGAFALGLGSSVIGQGLTFSSFDNFFGIGTPAQGTLAPRPSINAARPTVSAAGITLNTNSQVRGFNMANTAGETLIAASKSGLTVSDMNITTNTNNNGQYAVDFASSSGTFTFGTISVNSGKNGSGVNFSSTTSASTVTFGNVNSGAAGGTGTAVTITGSSSTAFTFADVTSSGTGSSVIVNNASGVFGFTSINANGATKGISVTDLTGSFTVNGSGATAGSGGTVQSCVTRGAEFTVSAAANTTSNITLKNMNFTGNGTSASIAACADGLNLSTTAFASLPAGCQANIYLVRVNGFTLNNVTANSSKGHGIWGWDVTTMGLTNCTLNSNGDAVSEDGVQIANLHGTNNFTNCAMQNNAKGAIEVQDNAAGATTVNITGGSYGNTTSPGAATTPSTSTAGDVLLLATNGTNSASLSSVITSATFSNIFGRALNANTEGNTSATIIFGSVASPNTISNVSYGTDINGTTSGSVTYTIDGNTFTNTSGSVTSGSRTVINARKGFGATGNWSGTITNNKIGTNGVAKSGCDAVSCGGIAIDTAATAGNYDVIVTGNTINRVNGHGIDLENLAAGTMRVRATGNSSLDPDDGTAGAGGSQGSGLFVATTGTGANINALIGGGTAALKNTVSGNWGTQSGGTVRGVRYSRGKDTVFCVSGYSGPFDSASVGTYITSQNTGNAGSATQSLSDSPPRQYTGPGCPTP